MIRDPWEDFAAVFAEELASAAKWDEETMLRLAEEYEREQIATARSEADFAALEAAHRGKK